jgi:glycosyltransferase involved in cell wall biosynthesis
MAHPEYRLLIVSSDSFFSTYGGGQVYVKNLVDELIRQNIYPVIVTPDPLPEDIRTYKGCQLETISNHITIDEIKKLLLRAKPNVVHAHGSKALFSKACNILNIPYIVTVHHGGILCPAGTLLNHRDEICRIKANPTACLPCVLKNIRSGLYSYPLLKLIPVRFRIKLGELIEKLPFTYYFTPVLQAQVSIARKAAEWKSIYTHSTRIIAPSHAIAESMIRNECPKEKISVIPHGIPIPEEKLLNHETKKSNQNRIKFFYMGRICHAKGVHIMLAAFSQIEVTAELHIIGGAGNNSEQRYMNKLRRRHRTNEQIFWHGKVDSKQINHLISQYDIMVHSAIYLEVFGLNIAEALALGKPVIATRCGGAEMQIRDGVNGWLVEPNNVESLKNIFVDIITNKKSVLRGFEQEVCSIETHVSALKNCYEFLQ